jgi:antirestriction protein ArdC
MSAANRLWDALEHQTLKNFECPATQTDYPYADLDITPEVKEDHADYIGSWLKLLKDGNRAVFQAASLASKAVVFLQIYLALRIGECGKIRN